MICLHNCANLAEVSGRGETLGEQGQAWPIWSAPLRTVECCRMFLEYGHDSDKPCVCWVVGPNRCSRFPTLGGQQAPVWTRDDSGFLAVPSRHWLLQHPPVGSSTLPGTAGHGLCSRGWALPGISRSALHGYIATGGASPPGIALVSCRRYVVW